MTYSWQNEDGEPIIDGAALRFEWALDAETEPYDPDAYLAGDYDDEECDDDHACADCDGPAGIWTERGFTPHPGAGWTCSYCDRPCPEGAHDD
jgi:hypothetical protein